PPMHRGVVLQPRPRALGLRGRLDAQGLLDGGLVLHRCVEREGDGHGDAVGLVVAHVRLHVVRGGRVDRGERTLDRHRLAVAAHGAAGPRVGLAVAERLGDLPRRPVLRQLTLDLLALGVGELDIGDGAPGDRYRYRITWGDVVG